MESKNMTLTTPFTAENLIAALGWGAVSAYDQYVDPRRLGRSRPTRPSDRDLIAEVREGPMLPETMAAWLNEYRLMHGLWTRKDNVRQERFGKIGAALESAYRVDGGIQPGGQAANLWQTAIENVKMVTTTNNPSLCMKAMWLYAPATVTMWDNLAALAVVRLAKAFDVQERVQPRVRSPHEAAIFLAVFENIFDKMMEEIHTAISDVADALTAERYPYPRRVLDKALWLLGAERPKRLSAMYFAAERYPACKDIIDQALDIPS